MLAITSPIYLKLKQHPLISRKTEKTDTASPKGTLEGVVCVRTTIILATKLKTIFGFWSVTEL